MPTVLADPPRSGSHAPAGDRSPPRDVAPRSPGGARLVGAARVRRLVRLLPLLLALLLATGCQITLVSSYDEQIDHSATELQKRLDGFLTGLVREAGTPAADYAANAAFYDDYAVELRALRLRAASQPQNTITVQQVDLMLDSLENLRALHEAGPVSEDTAASLRDLFSQSWRAILTLELAKKRGDA
jgi:hypothetical protein